MAGQFAAESVVSLHRNMQPERWTDIYIGEEWESKLESKVRILKRLIWITLLSFGIAFLRFDPAQCENLSYTSDPHAMLKHVSERGAVAVVQKLYEHPDDWVHALDQIKTGDEVWLRVAVELKPSIDAGSSSMLTEAVGLALLNVPGQVLRFGPPTFPLETICSTRPDPLPTYSMAIDELEKMKILVASVNDDDLLTRRDDCLRLLEASRVRIKRFFGVK